MDHLLQESLTNPHAVLGLHDGIIRCYRPSEPDYTIEVDGVMVQMEKVGEGLFEKKVRADLTPLDYRVFHKNGLLDYDPYAFDVLDGEMGGRLTTFKGVLGAKFVVWAPNAECVTLVCDTNYWDGQVNPMRRVGDNWILFMPGLEAEEKYKFEVKFRDVVRVKSDPYALYQEMRPKTASKLFNVDRFEWEDEAWIDERCIGPMNVYEVHLGSWRQGNYRSLAIELCEYVKDMGFTHVEVMPISEHPLDESWGYQVTGYYAVTSRYGTPEDFQFFVNHMHKNGIGVILDWVPAHFPSDDFSFARFDGTCLYEHEDARQGFHPHWNTMIFNYGRAEVVDFLVGSALYYLEKMHIDGLRVDAVASMLYLDFGRKEGEWIPNKHGGNENLEAIAFLKRLNLEVQERFSGVMVIAEDSTIFGKITTPVSEGGLGFTHRWNLGWMNDMCHFFEVDYPFREKVQHFMLDSARYVFSEKHLSPLSHDEVVHEKRSLLLKMPGEESEQFANVRLLLAWMYMFPGDHLLFMGCEFGQKDEWNCKGYLPWELLEKPLHQGLKDCVRDLNHLYVDNPELALNEFKWVDQSSCQIIFERGPFRCYVNPTLDALIHQLEGEVVFNTDDKKYGGEGQFRPKLATVITKL